VLFLLGRLPGQLKRQLKLQCEGTDTRTSYSDLIFTKSPGTATALMTYGDANEVRNVVRDYADRTGAAHFGSSAVLRRMSKRDRFKNIINVRLQEKGSGGQFAAVTMSTPTLS